MKGAMIGVMIIFDGETLSGKSVGNLVISIRGFLYGVGEGTYIGLSNVNTVGDANGFKIRVVLGGNEGFTIGVFVGKVEPIIPSSLVTA